MGWWSRALMWLSAELCQVKGHPELSPWLVPRSKIFKIVDNSGQLVPTFSSRYWQEHKKIIVLWYFFVLFTALMCSNSIFTLQMTVFLFLCKTIVFLFVPSLNLVALIRCLQNRYTDLKSAIDQPLNHLENYCDKQVKNSYYCESEK